MSKNGNIGNKIVGCMSFLITGFKVLGVTVLNWLIFYFKKLVVHFYVCSYLYKELRAFGILKMWDVDAMYVA